MQKQAGVEGGSRGTEPWFSDCEEEELKTVRGSDDEGDGPIIGLDGCFLKGMYRGQLLAAIGRDPNDNIYPIAFAYVEVEKYDSWEWFLRLLLRDIGSQDERRWTFISDRQKGLLDAVSELAPGAEHRFCFRHMYNNFKGKFKGQELKKLFWKAASTYSVNQHLRLMKEIETKYPEKGAEQTPYQWLAEIAPNHWARCYFPTKIKCDVLVNNMNESFNHIILEARELPIIDMFEWIRKKLMTRIQTKKEGMKKYDGVVCPNIIKKVETQRRESRNCFPSWAGEDKFEVMHFMQNHVVYLKDKFCSCGMFQLVGFPCCHAIALIDYQRKNLDDFVEDCFKKDVYLRVYSHMVHHVPGMHDFQDANKGKGGSPNVTIKVGRPKKARRRDANDNPNLKRQNTRNAQNSKNENATEFMSQTEGSSQTNVPQQTPTRRPIKKPQQVRKPSPVPVPAPVQIPPAPASVQISPAPAPVLVTPAPPTPVLVNSSSQSTTSQLPPKVPRKQHNPVSLSRKLDKRKKQVEAVPAAGGFKRQC
ncbi:UNVERIFIED_CONTAM: hypothetical protein Sradi_1760200 [Sesamum radiatum]|uniref:SWIM-type domain-containing protein n=1 Tax=Sesamum radiatum TaxID=300843 RepID=A0AAW2TVK3_SESRA